MNPEFDSVDRSKMVTIPLVLFDAMAKVYYGQLGIQKNPDPTPQEYKPEKALLELAREVPPGFTPRGKAERRNIPPTYSTPPLVGEKQIVNGT